MFALSEVGIESREEEDKSNKSKPGAHLGEILLRTSKMESINRLKLVVAPEKPMKEVGGGLADQRLGDRQRGQAAHCGRAPGHEEKETLMVMSMIEELIMMRRMRLAGGEI